MEPKKKKHNLFTLFFRNGKSNKPNPKEIKDESLFGVPLNDASDMGCILWGLLVPDLVYLCFEEICKKGLTTEGLFRLSGATSEVIMLENQLSMCSPDERKRVNMTQWDIHTLTSLVKKYLRLLPDPVIPISHHQQFLETDVHDVETFGNIIMKLPFYNRQIFQAILLMSSKIQEYVDFNMMSPEALATVFAPICTGFEQSIQTFEFSKYSPSKKDIEKHIATNKQWTMIWEEMIKERVFLIDMLYQQHFLEKENTPIRGNPIFNHHHYLNSRSLPSPFSATSATPLPEEIFMAQFTPMDTIDIAKPNQNRLKKTPNKSHLPVKSSTIKRIFTASTLRL